MKSGNAKVGVLIRPLRILHPNLSIEIFRDKTIPVCSLEKVHVFGSFIIRSPHDCNEGGMAIVVKPYYTEVRGQRIAVHCKSNLTIRIQTTGLLGVRDAESI